MIGTIRKHSKALWLLIIVVIIFAFVIWGSKTSQFDEAQEGNLGAINGQPVTSADYKAAAQEAKLRYFFARGEWPDRGFDLQRETYFQLLLTQKQNDLGIHVSPDAIATFARERIRTVSRGNPPSLDVFAKQLLEPRGVTTADFERYVRHELGLQQLVTLASLSGSLVSTEEIRSLYARENEDFSAQAVFFMGTNYLADVRETPAAISEFYTNHMSEYRLPDRMRVSYVSFPASNFLAEAVAEINQITNLAERLDAVYQIQKTNAANAAKTPEEVKTNILQKEQRELALIKAQRKASEFAARLFELTPARPENLEAFAQSNSLTAEISQAFDEDNAPKELEVRSEFAKVAFRLSADEPFAGPLAGTNAVYVIAPKQKIPSENPPFEAVREKVAQDYKFNQALTLARKAGGDFHQTLTNSLPAGKTFMAACTEAKLKPVLPPAFSLSSAALPEVEALVNLNLFKQAAFTTPVGRPSPFIPTRDGGFIVFVAAKLPLDETKMRNELPKFAHAVRQNRQSEAFNFWFQQEASRGLRDVPFFREQQRPPPPGGSGQ